MGGSSASLELLISLRDEASRGMQELQGVAQETSKQGGLLQNAFSFAMGGLLQQGLTAGLGAVSDFFSGSLEEANEAANGLAQLEAVLASTGGKAGWTKEQALALADSLSSANGVSKATDDAILAGQNMMLTFTNIGGEVFPSAMQAAVDMSQAMGTDLTSASMMLGKALNDPAEGLSKLSRSGVQFTAEQENLIKTLQAGGDMAGAQAVMLKELEVQFGGSALAAAGTFEGQMMTLQESFNSVKQSVGEALMPVLSQLMGFFTSPAVMGAIEGIATGLVEGIGFAASFLMPIIEGLIGAITSVVEWFTSMAEGATSVGDVFFNMSESIGGPLGLVLELVGGLVTAWQNFFGALTSGQDIFSAFGGLFSEYAAAIGGFFEQLGPMVQAALPVIWEFIQNLIGQIGEALPGIIAKLGEWGAAFVNWIGPKIPELLGFLAGLAGSILGWLSEQLPIIVGKLGEWGTAFVQWIGPKIPELLGQLAELAGQLIGWLAEQLGPILAKLGEWALAFVTWVAPKIPELLAELGKLIMAAIGWIGEQLPGILAKLGEWAMAFVNWVGPKILPLLAELGKMIAQVLGWIGEQALALIGKLVEWAGAFLGWIAKDVLPQLPGKLLELITSILNWIGTQVAGIVAKLLEWAGAFIGWVAKVLTDLPGKLGEIWTSITTWIGNTARAIPEKVGSIGKSIVDGIWNALKAAWDNFMEWLRGLVNGLPDFVKEWLGIASPSKVITDVFDMAGQGMIVGWEKNVPALYKTVKDSLAGLTDILEPGVQVAVAGVGAGASLAGGLPAGASSGALGGGGCVTFDFTGLTIQAGPGVNGAQLAEEFIEVVSQRLAERLTTLGVY